MRNKISFFRFHTTKGLWVIYSQPPVLFSSFCYVVVLFLVVYNWQIEFRQFLFILFHTFLSTTLRQFLNVRRSNSTRNTILLILDVYFDAKCERFQLTLWSSIKNQFLRQFTDLTEKTDWINAPNFPLLPLSILILLPI